MKKNFLQTKKFLIFSFLIACIIPISLGFKIYYNNVKSVNSEIVSKEQIRIETLKTSTEEKLEDLFGDLNFISEIVNFKKFLDDSSNENLELVQKDFLNFIEYEKRYDQIRFIDLSGQEIIRVNNENGNPYIVDQLDLQDKSNRYYFSNSISLKEEEIFVSPLDLNVENGQVEVPYKPMIRVVKPIFYDGEKKGVVVLNYLAQELLDIFEKNIINDDQIEICLINKDGYWLRCNDKDRIFGFMFPEKRDVNLPNKNPEFWGELKGSGNEEARLFYNDGDIINFITIKPFSLANYSTLGNPNLQGQSLGQLESEEYVWYLVTRVPESYITSLKNSIIPEIITIIIISVLVIIAATLFSYGAILKQDKFAKELSKFKLAVENSNDQIVITDPDGIILYVNDALFKNNGYKPQEAIGKKAGSKELWGGKMSKEFYQKMWHILKVEKKNFEGELININKSGEEYISSASISPILNNKGEVSFFVAIERDITKEKEIDKAKTEFVSLASHQLRTPLSAIRWYSEMLIDGDAGKLTKKQKDYVEEIINGNKRMIELVNALLNVSRIEIGTFEIEPIELDLVEQAKKLLSEFKVLAKLNKVKLKVDFQKKMPKVNVDPNILNIIFENLLSNAIKYSSNKKDAEVIFSIKKVKNKFIIEVEDNGCGIPKKQQEKIFSKMFRAENVQGTNLDGTGLGLYIIKTVLDKSGGQIDFESKEGKGTKFTVKIPLSGMNRQKGSRKLT